jgi:hypothetical protein
MALFATAAVVIAGGGGAMDSAGTIASSGQQSHPKPSAVHPVHFPVIGALLVRGGWITSHKTQIRALYGGERRSLCPSAVEPHLSQPWA